MAEEEKYTRAEVDQMLLDLRNEMMGKLDKLIQIINGSLPEESSEIKSLIFNVMKEETP